MGKVREAKEAIEADGWFYHHTTGVHHHFKHPTKPGLVTIPGQPNDDLDPGTERKYLPPGRHSQATKRKEAAMNHASAPDAELRIRVGRYVGVFAKTSTGYSAHVPSLPGLAVTGATLEQTIEHLRTGIPAHLEALAQDKIERPWLYAKRQVG